jgi:hypothetical protein
MNDNENEQVKLDPDEIEPDDPAYMPADKNESENPSIVPPGFKK